LEGMPDPDDRASLAEWLARLRAKWSGQIDVDRLAGFQKPKFRHGAFSTLLCVRLVPPDESVASGEASWRLQAVAIGDTCLFHVREGRLLRKFPIQSSAELEDDPVVLGSVDLNRDDLFQFHRLDEPCQSGDLVVLCTDAIADWALRLEESGSVPAWETYWEMDPTAWKNGILAMRAEREMRCDDATLALLRITDREPTVLHALCAGLPTPHTDGPKVSGGSGDLRSDDRRGQETCAERECPEPGQDTSAEPISSEPPPVSDAPPVPHPASPSEDWMRKIVTLSERATEGLAQGVARGVERLKKAGQAAQSKLKNYLDQMREDDR